MTVVVGIPAQKLLRWGVVVLRSVGVVALLVCVSSCTVSGTSEPVAGEQGTAKEVGLLDSEQQVRPSGKLPEGQTISLVLPVEQNEGSDMATACFGPQALECGGLPIANFEWDVLPGGKEKHVNRFGGVTAPLMELDGQVQGGVLTLTKPARVAEGKEHSEQYEQSDSSGRTEVPCDEPPGGWEAAAQREGGSAAIDHVFAEVPADSTVPSEEELAVGPARMAPRVNPSQGNRKTLAAPGQVDVAIVYLRDLTDTLKQDDETSDLGPSLLKVTVAGDVRRAEEAIRTRYSGALCVVEVEHSVAERERIDQELVGPNGVPGMRFGGWSERHYDLSVEYDDGSLQRYVDAKYGPGVVKVHSILALG